MVEEWRNRSRVEFSGPRAEQVWQNVHDVLDLLDGVESYHVLDSPSRRRIRREYIRDFITFIYMAAFRHELPRDWQSRARLRRMISAQDCVPGAFRLASWREDRELVFHLGGRIEMIPIGRLDGFTSVIPLTKAAKEEFEQGGLAPEQMVSEHISNKSITTTKTPYLYIGHLVHLPSLAVDKGMNTTAQHLNDRIRIMFAMLCNVVSAMVPLRYDRVTRRFEAPGGHPLPELFCIPDGRRMEDMIRGLGFQPLGLRDDVAKMEKFGLKFREYNEGLLDKEDRRRVRKTYKMIRAIQRKMNRGK